MIADLTLKAARHWIVNLILRNRNSLSKQASNQQLHERFGNAKQAICRSWFVQLKTARHIIHFCLSHLCPLVGLVVKASAPRAEDPGFDGIFPGRVIPATKKLALQWLLCQAPGIIGSGLGLVGQVSVYCHWVRLQVESATSISLLVGLVVKVSASRAEDPGFESRLRRDLSGVESYQ